MRTDWFKLGLIRTRLFLLVLLVVIPSFALVVFGNLLHLDSEKIRAREQALSMAKMTAASQQFYAKESRQLLSTLSQFPFLVLSTNRPFCENHFKNLVKLSSDYQDFGLVELDGTMFACAAGGPQRFSAGQILAFQKVKEQKRFSALSVPTKSGQGRTIQFGWPITNSAGEFSRVLYATLGDEVFQRSLSEVSLPKDGVVTVVDLPGNILAHHPDPENLRHKGAVNDLWLQKVLMAPDQAFDGVSLEGVKCIFGVASISDGLKPAFHVAMGIPQSTSLAQFRRILVRDVTLMIGVVVFVMAVAWLYSRRLLLDPIDKLLSASSRLAQGDLTARTGIGAGSGELHILGQVFDTMAENLGKRELDLKEANSEIHRINLELEKRVEDRTLQLQAVNKELEAFTYSVSHDLRAPLRHMDGFTQLLFQNPKLRDDPEVTRHLNLITKAARQMGNLIDDLLAFSKTGRQKMSEESVDFQEMVQQTISEMKVDQRDRTVHWHCSPLPTVFGDASMLRQVWINLISNALKYTRKREIAEIEIGSKTEATEQVFFIRDNGAGFDMKYADKLFGVFQRLHRENEFEGTGIGLANVRRIITRHGGRTWALGEPGRGATFFFSLPTRSS